MQRGFLAGLLGLLLGMDVCAQDRLPERSGWELGARYWLSTGQTKRSHNAQGEFPVLGNPTSVLTYDDLTAHAIELHARKSFANRWFVKGNLGLGEITRIDRVQIPTVPTQHARCVDQQLTGPRCRKDPNFLSRQLHA